MEIRRNFIISFRASTKKRGRGCEIKTNEGEDWQGRAGRGETIHVMNHTFGLELIQPAPGLLWQEGGLQPGPEHVLVTVYTFVD